MPLLPAPNAIDILSPSRRRFLQGAAATVASMALPCFGQTQDFWSAQRELWLYRPATRFNASETVREVYWANGQLVPKGYFKICQLLRDVQLTFSPL
jgi:hypothetical protein